MSEKPKIIHYCWFGNHPLPDTETHCIESWKQHLDGYEFKCWDENNFDISGSRYARQAYEAGKFAYVSDYVRTMVLYNYGGTYLDADMEILPGFRELIESNKNIFGFITSRQIGAGVISLEPHHLLMKRFIEYYDRDFFSDGVMNVCDNTSILTEFLCDKGLCMNRESQQIGDICVFSREYFYPKKEPNGRFLLTDDTVAIHHGSGSWMSERQRRRGNSLLWIKVCRPLLCGIKSCFTKTIGRERTRRIEVWVRDKLR